MSNDERREWPLTTEEIDELLAEREAAKAKKQTAFKRSPARPVVQDKFRQTGRTTSQIKHAPQGAVFVWHSPQTGYPRDLAKKLGREDLKIVSAHWLEWGAAGLSVEIIVDHHAYDLLTPAQRRGWEMAEQYFQRNKN